MWATLSLGCGAPSQRAHGADPHPTAPAAVLSADAAIARAVPAANAALDEAYARSETIQYGAVRTTPWASASDATVEGDAAQGWTIRWMRLATSGFEYEATVTVSATGSVRVEQATARFSPD